MNDDYATPTRRYPCACGCGKPLGTIRVGVFRMDCAQAILSDVRKLQSLEPRVLSFVASALHDAGATRLSVAAVGALPFGETW